MSNLMQRGAAWLGERLKAAAGRSVTYTRRGQSLTATAWPAKLDYDVEDDDGVFRRTTFYDWSFVTSDLDFANDPETFSARPGDEIKETLNGETLTYEVMPITSKGVEEWMDTAGELTVIHTKLVNRA